MNAGGRLSRSLTPFAYGSSRGKFTTKLVRTTGRARPQLQFSICMNDQRQQCFHDESVTLPAVDWIDSTCTLVLLVTSAVGWVFLHFLEAMDVEVGKKTSQDFAYSPSPSSSRACHTCGPQILANQSHIAPFCLRVVQTPTSAKRSSVIAMVQWSIHWQSTNVGM